MIQTAFIVVGEIGFPDRRELLIKARAFKKRELMWKGVVRTNFEETTLAPE
jgi:hypothetical protein